MKTLLFFVLSFFVSNTFSSPYAAGQLVANSSMILRGASVASIPIFAKNGNIPASWVVPALSVSTVVYYWLEFLMGNGTTVRVPIVNPTTHTLAAPAWTAAQPYAESSITPLASWYENELARVIPYDDGNVTPEDACFYSAKTCIDSFSNSIATCEPVGYRSIFFSAGAGEFACLWDVTSPSNPAVSRIEAGHVYLRSKAEGAAAMVCPTGYVYSGGMCALTALKREVMPDYKIDFGADWKDIDSSLFPFVGVPGGDFLYLEAVDPVTKEPILIELYGNPTAGYHEVTHYVQFTETDGSTKVAVDKISFSSAGQITAASHTVEDRKLTKATGLTAVDAPAAGSNISVVFPNDYARDSSIAAVGAKIDALTANVPVNDAPVLTEPVNVLDPIKDNAIFSSLRGVTVSGAGSCPVSSFDWNGSSFAINQHCQLIEDSWPVFQPVMIAIYLIFSMFIILRA